MNRRSIASATLAVMLALLAGSAGAADEKKPDATVSFTEGSVALGIGWTWGKGAVVYQGNTYKLKVDGLSVGEVGMTNAKATGKVYNLKKLEDISGVYSAGGAGATAGQGASAGALTNANGVSILVTSATKGASLKIAVEGIKLTLEK